MFLEKTMNLPSAINATLRSKRFWIWQISGAIIYAIPVAIRFATKNIAIPILNFPGFWIGHFIPGNFLEKLLVNTFFPGGAGGVAGETFVNNYKGEAVKGKTKYLARLGGALLQTAAWSAPVQSLSTAAAEFASPERMRVPIVGHPVVGPAAVCL